jgi:hypothetical protein
MRFTLLLAAAFLVQEAAPAPFFPLKEGAVWTYVSGGTQGKVKVTGREKIGETEAWVLTTQMEGEPAQREYLAADASGIRLLRQGTGERVTDYATPMLRLKLPPTRGEAWEWTGEIGEAKAVVKFKNEGEDEVKVPAGTYKAWKVSAQIEVGSAKHTGVNWFAPGVGIVKQHSQFDLGSGKKQDSLIELKSFEPGK